MILPRPDPASHDPDMPRPFAANPPLLYPRVRLIVTCPASGFSPAVVNEPTGTRTGACVHELYRHHRLLYTRAAACFIPAPPREAVTT
jgi:hypothetical protein